MFVDHGGTLVLIGGAENHHTGEGTIMRKVAELCGDHGNMLVVTVANFYQEETGSRYQDLFSDLGLKDTAVITMTDRSEANSPKLAGMLKDACGVFFTGGDQLRITGLLGGTEFLRLLDERYRAGAIIVAGTSAGAAAMSQVMIVGGREYLPTLNERTHMGPGLGLLQNAVVDQHFAQRGRIGRLLSAIAENPDVLGLGIDEDTAVVLRSCKELEVFGSGSITIVDGLGITHSNLTEASLDKPLALSDVVLHVLPAGYKFDLRSRTLLV